MCQTPPVDSALAPRVRMTWVMVRVSERSGTPKMRLGPLASRDATMMGREAFLEPLTSTSPLSDFPPSIQILSMRVPILTPLPGLRQGRWEGVHEKGAGDRSGEPGGRRPFLTPGSLLPAPV